MSLNRGHVYTSTVRAEEAGALALDWLCRRFAHSDSSTWSQRLAEGRVRSGQRPLHAAEILQAGQPVSWVRPPWQEPDAPDSFAILHRDEALLAVAKPSGLPTLPGGDFHERCLLRRVRDLDPAARPVHRLGRGTSGLVLFALSGADHAQVARHWRSDAASKVYRARVQGCPEDEAGHIEVPIGPVAHQALGQVHAASPAGRAASSRFRVLEPGPEHSLVEVHIDTGRPHQIRIHMAALGHPLRGDPLYRAGGVPVPGARPGQLGYRLHAMELTLPHPRTGQVLRLWCRPPPDLCTHGEGDESPGQARDPLTLDR